MESQAAAAADDNPVSFYICHFDQKRTLTTAQSLRIAHDNNYDTLSTPITNYAFQTRVAAHVSNHLYGDGSADRAQNPLPPLRPLASGDTFIAPGEAMPQLLGVISPWIDLTSPDPIIYDASVQVLEMEVAFAAFCGLTALVLPAPRLHYGMKSGQGISQYAYAVKRVLEIGSYIQISVIMPMMDNPSDFQETRTSLQSLARAEFVEGPAENKRTSITTRRHDFFGTWDAWNVIRSFCGYHPRFSVGLVIPRYLPPSSICSRWQSEPLRLLLLDSSSFFANPAGYPVLTANHRALISLYLRLRNPPCIVLTGVDPIPDDPLSPRNKDVITAAAQGNLMPSLSESLGAGVAPADDAKDTQANEARRRVSKFADPLAHLNYLRWFQVNQPPKSLMETFGAGYQDFLQTPLQPLTDNLESITYEVFEKDPIKYDLYEKAIYKALRDWQDQGKATSSSDYRVVVAVVGAGRGPLVSRARKASAAAEVPIELWALEKNPNAFVLLQRHNTFSWNSEVRLVQSDMRSWRGPCRAGPQQAPYGTGSENLSHDGSSAKPAQPLVHYPIDIVVSELLGSFADNELSPECLDGICPLLNPNHGISIPCSYSAHLTPISTPKLHADISSRASNESNAPNTPYVVMLHSFDFIATRSHTSAYGPDHVTIANGDQQRPQSIEYAALSSEEEGLHMTKPPSPLVLQAWSFQHGPQARVSKVSANAHNRRHARLSFDLRHRAVCHGLAGYFEAVLYPGVELSTNPLNMAQKSPDMMSWFPIFFPLKTPLHAPDNSSLAVTMFRETDNRKVWYEWMVEAWTSNQGTPNGFRLGCSQLGSSKENGCMM